MPPRRAAVVLRRALQQGRQSLIQAPAALLGFSACACGLHLLGWALFAAGHLGEGSALTLLLNLAGVVVYTGSIVWLVQGLTRGGLAAARGVRPQWRDLVRWRSREALALLGSLLAAGGCILLAGLVGFVAWSLATFVLPAFSVIPAVLALVLVTAASLSQLFVACLLLDAGLSPSSAVRSGIVGFERCWPFCLGLGLASGLILLLPFAAGFLAEALVSGLGVAITVLAMVAALPLLSCTVTAGYLQLAPTLLRPEAPKSGAAGGRGWPDNNG